MHPARSAISKTPPPTPNLLREDILLEAFEQAGKKVTEHVLDSILGAAGAAFRGHEFHYADVASQDPGEPLFTCSDARGCDLGPAGQARDRVMGSFIHLIDREAG